MNVLIIVHNYFYVGGNHNLLSAFCGKLVSEKCMRYSLIAFFFF